MSPLAYGHEAKAFVRRWRALPFLQGHRAAAGAIRALLELQRVRHRAVRPMPAARGTGARRCGWCAGVEGPLDEARAARILELYGVRRPPEAVVTSPARAAAAAARLGGAVAVKALAPELPAQGAARRRPAGAPAAGDVEAAAAEVLRGRASRRRRRAEGAGAADGARATEVLVGALVDERFGACVTMRPGGALAEAGAASFVAAPADRRARRAPTSSRRPSGAGSTRAATTCAPLAGGRRVDRSGGPRSPRSPRLARGQPVAGRAVAAPSPSTRWPRSGHPRDLRAHRGRRLGARGLLRRRRRAGASGACGR